MLYWYKSANTDAARNEKRFRSLQTVRPAFMDEYEALEDELQDLFRDYLEVRSILALLVQKHKY